VDKFQTYVETNRERFLAELQDFCRQPSVAAQNRGMREMADKVLMARPSFTPKSAVARVR
jgi:hypothetical protein